MYKYERILYWSEADGRFIVEVPELAGCKADGATAEEALQNAEIIISEWVETAQEIGREIPQPKYNHSMENICVMEDKADYVTRREP